MMPYTVPIGSLADLGKKGGDWKARHHHVIQNLVDFNRRDVTQIERAYIIGLIDGLAIYQEEITEHERAYRDRRRPRPRHRKGPRGGQSR